MVSKTRFWYPFILLMFLCAGAAMDTIRPGNHLNSSTTVVSVGEMFELGFFQPTDSEHYYVGIWYKNIKEDPVVWIANRDYPVTASAFFGISDDGNLEIKQGRIIYRVTDMTLPNANVSAKLLDSGNLILRDENSSILWQSFDFPSHTYLPGMKLGYDTRIQSTWSYVSWKSSNDPSPGNFTLKLDSGPEKQIMILNGDAIYWRSIRSWGDSSNYFEFPVETRLNMYNFSFVSESDTAYLTYNIYRNDTISRFTIDATGQLRQLLWLDNEWSVLNSQPGQPCEVYAYCGANSSCSNVSSPICSCLPGYKPSSVEFWNNGDFKEGCSRKNELQCGKNDGFHMLTKVILPQKQLTREVQSFGDCRSSCLSNCSCSGFSYTDRNCSIWTGELINLQQLPVNNSSGTDFYLKLAATDLETKKSSSNMRRAVIVSVTVTMTVFTSAFCFWQVKVKRDKRKGQDLLSFEVTMSPSHTQEEQCKGRWQVEHEKEVEIPLFSFSSVSAATDNFSFSNKLGEGGFGPVYKGKLLKGDEVAVKRLSRQSGQGWDELKNEAILIGKLQHKNLVKVLGCCIERDEKILIYEYLPNKSLDTLLFGTNAMVTLPWKTRVRIIEGIAQGLLYLHQYSRVQIIHRDLKASNILLDEDMNPKISDFGMANGISRDTDVKGVLPAITLEGKAQMVAAIETFQMAFLGSCLSRLSDIVNSVFPVSSRGSVPSKEQISRILSRIQEEIEAVQLDARLTLLVLREISKVLLLIAERAEYLISTGPEARQVSGPATAAQVKNFALCQHLQEIHTRVTSMIMGLPTIAADVLSPSLGAIYGVACDSITSLFQAMIDRLESCILQIHDQNFSALGMDAAMDNNASPYMEELQKCILPFRREFLSRLLPSSANATTAGTETICTRLVRSMASRVLILFIRHASLVRPLSESGKLRMARDMAELELAVGQNLFPVEQLGAPYRALRAFRPLIFLETSQLGASPLLQDLPPSVILHHLYSRGPDDLQSPLQRNKLTHLQYSLWLDSQGEDQIWKGIKATLDDYATKVRVRRDKEFSPVYPLMLRLGSSLSETAPASQK